MSSRRPVGGATPVITLFVLAHFTHHIISAVAAPLLPMIRTSFDLSYTQAGVLLTAFTVSYGLGHLPAGWLTDRVNPLVMVFTGISGVGVAGLAFGVAPTFILLMAANVLIGLAGSGYHPSASYLISRITPEDRRGRALGIHVIGGSASYFAAPLAAGGLALALGWRSTYIILSAPTIVLGLILVLLLRRASVGHLSANGQDREAVSGPHDRRFWIWLVSFLALSTLGGALIGSVIGFIPLMLVDSFGMREEVAGGLLALVFSGGFWIAPLAGHLSDRIGKVPLLLFASAIAVPAVYLMPRVSPGPALYALLVLTGVFVFIRMPVSEAFLYSHAPGRWRSTLLGVYFLGASLGGGVFTPIIGRIADLRGFRDAFSLVAVVTLAATLAFGACLVALGPGGRPRAVSLRSTRASG